MPLRLSREQVNTSVLLNWDFNGILDSLMQNGTYWAVSVWCLVVVIGRCALRTREIYLLLCGMVSLWEDLACEERRISSLAE